ncbi:RE1-silencing transcription factor-like isoform X2 [Plodia interpunctella]|uniref:RE1-silencing transcription factor-like isoform X2 n=1 Tax=Plodia interpunctella TaxID=58824 RepID=UPI002368540F|nr:RE1-silencing transcription factor-like isoform X2 [Plodia interpunctella]XP_053614160.1 RE1-silencing transcription factor-like isoform X2 [Plodia interpunctella]
MSNRAWVTLATNDSYGLGALVLAHSLRRAGSAYPSVVLITPSVTEPMRDRLRAVFAEVVLVDVLDSRDATHLALLQRPELGITFTKIHCWGLTQYEKCVFLDADTLIVQNCDELFEREELSAAPDVGWPDCFNSGVFVYRPSAETFEKLIKFAQERGSFDGGDQGLLNSFFSDWARGDINKHLPFLYNVTSAAFYSYLPALKHYGQNLKIIHFIGAAKPWLQQFNFQSRTVDAPEHLREFLQLWWDLFVSDVHSKLDESMVEEEGVLYRPPALLPHDVCQHYEPQVDPESEFPWHHPSAQIQEQTLAARLDFTEFHNPWDIYKGHIPPINNETPVFNESQRYEDHGEMRKYAWEYKSEQGVDTFEVEITCQNQGRYEYGCQQWDANNQSNQQHQTEHWLQEHHHDHSPSHEHQHDSFDHVNTQYFDNIHYKHSSHEHHDLDNYSHKHSSYHSQHHVHKSSHEQNFEKTNLNFDNFHHIHQGSEAVHPSSEPIQVQHVHVGTEQISQRRRNLKPIEMPLSYNGAINGGVDSEDSEIYDDIIPRHPYDGFYLRHRPAIDAHGRKVCSHELPPTPSSSPPPSLLSESPTLNDIDLLPEDNGYEFEDDQQSGVAGNLARVVAGVGAPREALDELSRRQGWEAGNIDYMGADSFDNIWAKISQTLNQTRISPPKQPSPPKEPAPKQPSPPKEPAPKQPSPTEEPAIKQPSPPKEPAPKQPSPPKEPAPKQPSPPEEPAIKQPSPPKEPAPKQPSPLKELAPKQPSPPKEPAPKQPSPPKEPTPKQPSPPKEPAPKQPSPPKEPTPKQPSPPKEPAPQQQSPPKESAPKQPSPSKEPPAIAPVEVAQEAVVIEAQAPSPAPVADKTPVPEVPVSVQSIAPTEVPVSEQVPITAEIPAVSDAVTKLETQTDVPLAAEIPSTEIPTTVETPAGAKVSVETPAVEELKIVEPIVPPTPPATPKSSPEASKPDTVSEGAQEPVPVTVEASKAPSSETAKPEATPEKSESSAVTDSPPLANTPSKEETPSLPAAKSIEEAAQETRL